MSGEITFPKTVYVKSTEPIIVNVAVLQYGSRRTAFLRQWWRPGQDLAGPEVTPTSSAFSASLAEVEAFRFTTTTEPRAPTPLPLLCTGIHLVILLQIGHTVSINSTVQ